MTVPSNENFSAHEPVPSLVPHIESQQVATWEDVKSDIPEFTFVIGAALTAAGAVGAIVIESQMDNSSETTETSTKIVHEGQPMLFGHDQKALHNAHDVALWGFMGGGALLGIIGLAGMAAKADRRIRQRLGS